MTRRSGNVLYRVTPQARHRVELMISAGRSEEEIAAVLGISVATLKRRFASQLKHGLVRKETELLEKLWDGATKDRNSASQRAYAKLIAKTKTGAAREKARADRGVPERPGIDRALFSREANEFAHWCHRGTAWESFIDDPEGAEPQWSIDLRAWLARGSDEP